MCVLLVKTYINAQKQNLLFSKARQIHGLSTLNGSSIEKVPKLQPSFPKNKIKVWWTVECSRKLINVTQGAYFVLIKINTSDKSEI